MTVATKAANECGCSTCYSRIVPSRSCRRLKRSRDGYVKGTRTEIRQDVGRRRQDRCHTCTWHNLNSDILKSYAQFRTMLLTITEHKRIRPLVMLHPWISRGWAKAKARMAKARKAKATRRATARQRQGQCQNDQALSWVVSCPQGLEACDEGVLVE